MSAPARRPWLGAELGGLLPIAALALLLAVKQLAAVKLLGLPVKASIVPGSLAPMLLLAPLLAPVPRRLQLAAIFLLDALLSLVIVADVINLHVLGELASAAQLGYAAQLGDVAGSVLDELRPSDLLPFADLPLLLVGMFLLRARPLQRPRPLAALVVAAVAAATLFGVWRVDPGRDNPTRGAIHRVSRWGLFSFHANDLFRAASRRVAHRGAPPERLDVLAALLAARRVPHGPLFGVAKGRNLIVIQVESIMAFALGLEVEGTEVTPNLNRLAAESLRFRQLFEHTGSGLTADADAAVNCSLFPLRNGVLYVEHGGAQLRCLPAVLAEAGYDCEAFQAIRADFWNLSAVYPGVGFASFHHVLDYDSSSGKLGLGLSDTAFLEQSSVKLEALREPFHAFLVTLSSHHPYAHEGMPHTLPLGALAGEKLGAYLDALHYTDAALGAFLERLRADGLLGRSVVALYGDHRGPGIAGNPQVAKLVGLEPADEVSRFELDRRIPLLIRLPGGAHAADVSTLGGQVDLAPTLAALLGVEADAVPWMGRDLLGAGSDRLVPIFDGSALSEERIVRAEVGGAGHCLDRATHRAAAPGSCAELEARAAALLDASGDVVSLGLSSSVGERLAKLPVE